MTWQNTHDDSSNSQSGNLEIAMELAKQKAKYVYKCIHIPLKLNCFSPRIFVFTWLRIIG